MFLPTLPSRVQTRQRQQLQIMGLNTSTYHADGSFASCNNISSEKYPAIIPSERVEEICAAFGRGACIYAWNDQLVMVDLETTRVMYGERELGFIDTVKGNNIYKGRNERKQFVVAANKLCIFPDAVYIDLDELAAYEEDDPSSPTCLHRMGAELYLIHTGKSWFSNAEMVIKPTSNGEGSMQTLGCFAVPTYLTADFRTAKINNGAIRIEGCMSEDDDGIRTVARDYGNPKYAATDYYMVSKHVIYFEEPFRTTGETSDDPSNEKYRTTRVIEATTTEDHVIPYLDYVCHKDNKIYGCSNQFQTIYVSAQGDPLDFNTYEGVATDAYAVAVGSDEKFTGVLSVGNSVCFFKQHTVHKLMGSIPSEYYLYEYKTDGVMEGMSESLCNIDGVAWYISEKGLTAFSGSSSQIVSNAIDGILFSDAVAMYNGRYFYLSLIRDRLSFPDDEGGVLLRYDCKYGVWTQVHDQLVLCLAHIDNADYFSEKDRVCVLLDGTQTDSWSITFNPFVETITGSYRSQSEIFTKKKYTRLFFRLELPKESKLVIELSGDGKRWTEAGYLVGTEAKGVISFRVSTERLDEVHLRLTGKGKCTIHSIEREYIQCESEK